MNKNKEEKENFITLTEVKSLGFSPKMIEALLPEPILKTNPRYKCAAPMKLWKEDIVYKAMETKEFTEARKISEKRRSGAAKAVETKRAKLRTEVDEQIKKIHVTKINMDKLHDRTIRDKQDWYDYQDMLRCDFSGRCAEEADEATIQRWMVNYIRHNLTDYDEDLYDMAGKVGCHEEYERYKHIVMDKISEVYPELKGECEKQIERSENSLKFIL